jgi:peptide-methionine (S)-S-oxide reductase
MIYDLRMPDWFAHLMTRSGVYRKSSIVSYLAVFAALALAPIMNAAPESTNAVPKTQLATFGGGCFWCTEAVFQSLNGVKSVKSGYAGGATLNPTYEQVCSGTTGHAEVIQIEFDPAKVSYEKLLEVFWQAHDPTTLNRQGADSGTQYRSIILYHDEAQKKAAEKSKAESAKNFSSPITTEIVVLTKFYPGENYHQNYYRQNKNQPYCRAVIRPKLDKLQEHKVIPAEK